MSTHRSTAVLKEIQQKHWQTTRFSSSSTLAPPKKNERRHSLGGKLVAALHL